MGAQVSLSWLNMQPPLGQGHQGCALVWALLSPDPAAHCPREGTGPAGGDMGTVCCPCDSPGGEESRS